MRRAFRSTALRPQAVSLDSIKRLRSRTGAPINAVKQALEAQSGDIEAAFDHLRKMGASMVAKKAHREASQGLISVSVAPDRKSAALVELNSETDFVARTPQFAQLINSLVSSALQYERQDSSGLFALQTDRLLAINDLSDQLSDAVSSLGENIVLKRASLLQVDPTSSIFGYVHGKVSDNNGTIGVLAALDGDDVEELGPRIAMHIAAAVPSYLSVASVPEAHLEKERQLLMEAAKSQSASKPKPEKVLNMIAEGKLRKWYSEVVLEEQEMLVETSHQGKPRSVSKAIKADAPGAEILQFARFAVGEKA